MANPLCPKTERERDEARAEVERLKRRLGQWGADKEHLTHQLAAITTLLDEAGIKDSVECDRCGGAGEVLSGDFDSEPVVSCPSCKDTPGQRPLGVAERVERLAQMVGELAEAGRGLLILAQGFRDLTREKPQVAPLDRVLIQDAIDRFAALLPTPEHAQPEPITARHRQFDCSAPSHLCCGNPRRCTGAAPEHAQGPEGS